jgi:SET domain-containing protein
MIPNTFPEKMAVMSKPGGEANLIAAAKDPNSLNIRISSTSSMGRGVFAVRKIAKDEVIEKAPVIVLPEEQWDLIEPTDLRDYVFSWGDNDELTAVALGYVSIYNHSYTPNAMYVQAAEDVAIEIVALRDIDCGEEILVNYNGEPDDQEELWFPTL